MKIYEFDSHRPLIHESCFIAPSAEIIGKVEIGNNSSVWFQTVIRGDVNYIKIGANTNIQDLSMLHVASPFPLIIGNNITVGHHVNLHACVIGDNCLIGMGAIVMDGAIIKANSVVAAGSVVPPGKQYPEGVLIMGSPAKVIRSLTEEERRMYGEHYKIYLKNKDLYKEKFYKI